MTDKPSMLIIEDEEPIRLGLIDIFVYHGYEVDAAEDGEEGLEKALNNNYNMIILDVMLPGIDGFRVCEKIREVDREQPIIMLTAKSSDQDIIAGLSLGADDYVSKPFSVQELVLRVEAVLRRANVLDDKDWEIVIGESLHIDTRNLVAKYVDPDSGEPLDEQEIEFTRREIEILQYLQAHNDRPVARDELLAKVWGYRKTSNIETRTVDIHIAKIRRKIEKDQKNPEYLITVRGEGYKLLGKVNDSK